MKQQEVKKQFTDLYISQSDALFRYCFFRVSDREQAIDIVQESFTKLWDTIVKEKSEIKNSRALLFKIASNMVIDWYRKKKAISLDALLEPESDQSTLQLSDDSYKDIEIASEGKMAIDYMLKLDPVYQQVVYLRYVEDMSPKEIAAVVGLSVNVVSVRINRGIQELRKKYGLQ